MTIAIRVHYSNKRKDVYLATQEEWEEYFEQTFNNTEQLLQKVETWAKAKKQPSHNSMTQIKWKH